tara:strand:- start:220 stop:438 length:219 start_codon:yes stop_codon:yes gene_type:complete
MNKHQNDMTAKEKAKELVEKYQFNGDMIDDIRMSEECAIESALICVDEIVKNTLQVPQVLDYWNEVKQYLLL